jgi:hypothetical protein
VDQPGTAEGALLVVTRFRVGVDTGPDAGPEAGVRGSGAPPEDRAEVDRFRHDVHAAHEALAARPGYVRGHVGRNLDDPALWVLTTTWVNVGSYRRALSSYDVKVSAVPLLSRAIDEPSAYETITPGLLENQQRPRTSQRCSDL